jgi:hypothetical protein
MSNSAPKPEEKPPKSNWGFVQWAILGAEQGAICVLMLIIVILLNMPGSSSVRLRLVQEWLLMGILQESLLMGILFIGLMAALSGLGGWPIVDDQKEPAKSIWSIVQWALLGTLMGVICTVITVVFIPLVATAHISGYNIVVLPLVFAALGGMAGGFIAKKRAGATLGGLVTGFFPLCVALVIFFWPVDPICAKMLGSFTSKRLEPTLGGQMHPSVSFDNRGYFEYYTHDTGLGGHYRCKNGQVTIEWLSSGSEPGQYNPITDTFDWNGDTYYRAGK